MVKAVRDLAGPSFWRVFHILCVTVNVKDPEELDSLGKYIECMATIFPCEKCRRNLQQKLEAYPWRMYSGSNEELFFMSYLYHDIVNRYNGKVSPKYTPLKEEYFALFKDSKKCVTCL
jgi:hypothetical protein